MRRLLAIGTLILALGLVAQGQDYYRASSASTFVGGSVANPILLPDGTAGGPALAFASETTLGWYRSAAGTMNLVGGSLQVPAGGTLSWPGRLIQQVPADGLFKVFNGGATAGSTLKIDALPTVASGFGTSPAITAGSTALDGSVNVGTGGVATTGTITFGGTAYPSAPFCVYSTQTTNAVTRGAPTTTQLVLNSTTAWTASDLVSWHCISSK